MNQEQQETNWFSAHAMYPLLRSFLLTCWLARLLHAHQAQQSIVYVSTNSLCVVLNKIYDSTGFSIQHSYYKEILSQPTHNTKDTLTLHSAVFKLHRGLFISHSAPLLHKKSYSSNMVHESSLWMHVSVPWKSPVRKETCQNILR